MEIRGLDSLVDIFRASIASYVNYYRDCDGFTVSQSFLRDSPCASSAIVTVTAQTQQLDATVPVLRKRNIVSGPCSIGCSSEGRW